jgi:hypothetical protein
MPLFERRDPDVGSLIAYVVARSLERSVTLNQTKLVKLLYLIDLERAASGRHPLTGLRWVFFHYGPYALELPEILEPLEGSRLTVSGWEHAKLYRAAPEAPTGEEWPPATRRQVDDVIRRYAALDLNELLDFVYFHTAPMRDAVRGAPLDMSRARTEPPPRPQPPLSPPAVPEHARTRLEAWRQRRSRELRPLSLEERRSFFTDPSDEELAVNDLHGRMVVSPDAER